ncbi:MAG: hypothetical protein JWN25_2709 [Verrucomicrobiales bacterium]|nr:hypothetical protein [Verrucomicrobiales bacterium]
MFVFYRRFRFPITLLVPTSVIREYTYFAQPICAEIAHFSSAIAHLSGSGSQVICVTQYTSEDHSSNLKGLKGTYKFL